MCNPSSIFLSEFQTKFDVWEQTLAYSRRLTMDRHAYAVQTRVQLILEILKGATISEEGYDSTQMPFFLAGDSQAFTPEHKDIPKLPDGVNRNLLYLYQLIGNPDVEVMLLDRDGCEWTILSLNKALDLYESYKAVGQTRVFDIAYRYLGLGHIEMVSCDTETHNLFYRRDGGSNGWDRDLNYKETIEFTGSDNELFFLNWFCRFKTPSTGRREETP